MNKMVSIGLSVVVLIAGVGWFLTKDQMCYDNVMEKAKAELESLDQTQESMKKAIASNEAYKKSFWSESYTFDELRKAYRNSLNFSLRLMPQTFQFERMMKLNNYDTACNYLFDGVDIRKK